MAKRNSQTKAAVSASDGVADTAAGAAPHLPSDIAAPQDTAAAAGLRYVSDARPGLTRRRAGRHFRYRDAAGKPVSDAATLRRIRTLAVPPAWTDVWICPHADGHMQATGRDAKGRKQYRYHPRFRAVRDSSKYQHVIAFARALPAIRKTVRAHMRRPGLPREKVLATVVYLLDKTLIRIGNDDYARHNKSYGLTTLKNRHAEVDGSEVRFRFIGKSGKEWLTRIKDRRVARIIRACQDLPGQELLQYRDAGGAILDVTSTDVNAYLREVTGTDVTAKDFRTWAGTVLAGIALKEVEAFDSAAQAKRNVRAAIETVAKRLGNTPAICRKCYVHPEILNAYLDGALVRELARRSEKILREKVSGLEPEEAAVLALLRARLKAAASAPKPLSLRAQLRQSQSTQSFAPAGRRQARRTGGGARLRAARRRRPPLHATAAGAAAATSTTGTGRQALQ